MTLPLLVLVVFLLAVPVATSLTRGLIIISLLCAFVTVLLYLPRARWLRIALVLVLSLLIGRLLLGDNTIGTEQLRQTYLSRLRAYSGAPYLWGGESHWGIDCSGLARMALLEAMVAQGITRGNRHLLWHCAGFWWHDMSARAMRDGLHGYTRRVEYTVKLTGYRGPDLLPGDLAVADSGIHVLIYLGDDWWIQASPDERKVLALNAGESPQHIWFNTPMVIMRWRILE